ncbi:MAG: S8 family serine peptidase [Caldilineaceae bacterium]
MLAIKVLDNANRGYYSWIAAGIIDAVDAGAHVINLSLGGASTSETLHAAVRYAADHDVTVVSAMMNQGNETLYYPAAFTETIAVGATTSTDVRAGYSNTGDHIDLVAPGSSIMSTLWDDDYGSWSGTSMAVPHVAGTVGLMLSVNPGLTPEEIRTLLRGAADPIAGDAFSTGLRLGVSTRAKPCAAPILTGPPRRPAPRRPARRLRPTRRQQRRLPRQPIRRHPRRPACRRRRRLPRTRPPTRRHPRRPSHRLRRPRRLRRLRASPRTPRPRRRPQRRLPPNVRRRPSHPLRRRHPKETGRSPPSRRTVSTCPSSGRRVQPRCRAARS